MPCGLTGKNKKQKNPPQQKQQLCFCVSLFKIYVSLSIYFAGRALGVFCLFVLYKDLLFSEQLYVYNEIEESTEISHIPPSSMYACCCLVAKSCPALCNSVDCVAHQAPLPMGFFRQEYWSGLPFPSPRDLLDPGIKPLSPALAGGFFLFSGGLMGRISGFQYRDPGSIPGWGAEIPEAE